MTPVVDAHDLLLLNVGFIIHETIGYSRDFDFSIDQIHLPPDLDLKDLEGEVRVTRTAQGLLVQVKAHAKTNTICSRCLVEFYQPLQADFTELYAFTPNSITESGLLVPENGKINLAPLLREELILSLPINPVCQTDCKGLCPICGENLNETTCHHEDEDIDPRLDVLKSLKKREAGESE